MQPAHPPLDIPHYRPQTPAPPILTIPPLPLRLWKPRNIDPLAVHISEDITESPSVLRKRISQDNVELRRVPIRARSLWDIRLVISPVDSLVEFSQASVLPFGFAEGGVVV